MTADQKKYAEDFLAENPNVKEMFLNPSGEWFTNRSYAMNSLPKNKESERDGEIESVKAKAEKTTTKK